MSHTTSGTWEGCLLFLAVTVIACSIVAAATWLVCWSFYIPYHARYSVGVVTLVLMSKWLLIKHISHTTR